MTEGPLTVLYAEDDREDIMLFSEALFSYSDNIKLILASNGKEVLQMLKGENPDIVFMDINMPLMDGLKCLKNIRGMDDCHCEVPVAMVSTSNVMKDTAMKLGATYYFTKPIDQDIWYKIFEEAFSVSVLKKASHDSHN